MSQLQFFTPNGTPITAGIVVRPGQGYNVDEIWHIRGEYAGFIDEEKIASCKFGHLIMFGGYSHKINYE